MTGRVDGEWVVLNPLEDFETVHPGHHDIEQDGVELLLGDDGQRRRAIIRFDDIKAAPPEETVQYGSVVRYVVDDEQSALMGWRFGHMAVARGNPCPRAAIGESC